MPKILEQKDAQKVRRREFCYLCGQPITQEERDKRLPNGRSFINGDHVPPETLFQTGDRNWPLKLDVHTLCNTGQSESDETISGVLQTGKPVASIAREKIRLSPERFRIEGSDLRYGVFDAEKLDAMMWRWISGFHAALYNEYLPPAAPATPRRILPPGPMCHVVDGSRVLEPLDDFYRELTLIIKRNMYIGNTDAIESNNGKCLYHCVWKEVQDAKWEAYFALKVCDWDRIGEHDTRPRYGCVGFYTLPSRPATATIYGTGFTAFLNAEEFDPFGR